jgi:putative nucleotidyltransferase with HDIG domain
MSKRIEAYVAIIVALSIAAGWWVYSVAPMMTPALVRASVWFAVLFALCELLAYQKAGRRETGSLAFLPLLAAVVVAPSWLSVLAFVIANGVVQVIQRRIWLKSVFNVALTGLAVSLAIIVYRLCGGHSFLEGQHPLNVLAIIASLVIFVLANTGALKGAIALSERKTFWDLWRETVGITLLYDFLASPFVYACAWLYVQFGPMGAISFVFPILGFRQLNKTNWELQKANQELLQLMVAAIEARDPYTSGHSRRVARNAKLIAEAIGLKDKQVERARIAALLHDVGKIHEVFAPILSKPGRLTADENAIMQTHPIKSAELVQTVSQLSDVVESIRNHHENWDGTGYPDGLVGENIPIASRIIMFADTIDAMTTDRPYRAALTEAQVRAEFVKLRGRQFDPTICDRLLSNPIYPKLFDQDVPLTPVIAEQGSRMTPLPIPRLAS